MSDKCWKNSWGSAAQFFLAQTYHQSWSIFSMVVCLQTTHSISYDSEAQTKPAKQWTLQVKLFEMKKLLNICNFFLKQFWPFLNTQTRHQPLGKVPFASDSWVRGCSISYISGIFLSVSYMSKGVISACSAFCCKKKSHHRWDILTPMKTFNFCAPLTSAHLPLTSAHL